MQIDDEVYIVLGADVPFVIRQNGPSYTLVGECYVHGLMQGQAYRAWKNKVLQEKDVTLR